MINGKTLRGATAKLLCRVDEESNGKETAAENLLGRIRQVGEPLMEAVLEEMMVNKMI